MAPINIKTYFDLGGHYQATGTYVTSHIVYPAL